MILRERRLFTDVGRCALLVDTLVDTDCKGVARRAEWADAGVALSRGVILRDRWLTERVDA